MKAWLVTWEWNGDHAKVDNPIVAIINPRKSARRVLELVEQLYVINTFSFEEQMGYANNRKFNPYPAQFGNVEGIQWEGQIFCGHNPWLFARKVSNLHTESWKSGEGKLVWDEDRSDVIARIRKDQSEIQDLDSAYR